MTGPRKFDGEQAVIICPYVQDADAARVTAAFGLDSDAGRHLPFFLWQDTQLLGPERAFEACWEQFPDRDVVIVHTDMSPLPDDRDNSWFRALLAHAARLPDAGIVACDLLYPEQKDGEWLIQCAGGNFDGGKLGYIHSRPYGTDLRVVREVAWATFGGVYIRREAIDLCGRFDRRYEWAYVMDVDYSLEIRQRGFRIYQVPVNLLHEENRTTRDFLALPEYRAKVESNAKAFFEKWQPVEAHAVVPPLTPGERISLRAGGGWTSMLGRGWSAPEEWGVWSDGSEAILVVKLPDNWRGPATIRLELLAFVPPGGEPQRVRIRTGSVETGEWRITDTPMHITIDLGDRVVASDPVFINLRFPDALSPSQAVLSADERTLGVGLVSLALSALPEPATAKH